jgi:hypothetical protein
MNKSAFSGKNDKCQPNGQQQEKDDTGYRHLSKYITP